MIPNKRAQQSLFQAAEDANRFATGGGASAGGLMGVMQNAGYAAAGNQGAYSTANNATFTTISNTSFNLIISRPTFFFYMFYAAARLSAAGALGYIRGDIVGYSTAANLEYGTTGSTNGFLWLGPQIQGPIQPGAYTCLLQAATDNAGFTITVDQFFHQFLVLGA